MRHPLMKPAAFVLSGLLAISLWGNFECFAQATTVPNSTYTQCAVENATCKVTAPGTILYGASAHFLSKHVTADTACTNAVFTDPIYGTAKACWFLADPVVQTYPTTTGWYPATFVPIAVPDGAAQLDFAIADAKGCTSTPIARQWNDAATRSQIWAGWCQKKGKYDQGYLFVWLRSTPSTLPLPAGVNPATVPVTWPTE